MTREVRFLSELRAAKGAMKLSGYAARFNELSGDLGGFRELIRPGAFKRSLETGADVVATLNHDVNFVLGRTKSGTLKLREDSYGLAFECALDPGNSMHQNVHASIARGDISECSFAFTVSDGGQLWEQDGTFAKRTLCDVNLLDVSAVTFPAYPGTEVSARAKVLFPEGAPDYLARAIKQFAPSRAIAEERAAESADVVDARDRLAGLWF